MKEDRWTDEAFASPKVVQVCALSILVLNLVCVISSAHAELGSGRAVLRFRDAVRGFIKGDPNMKGECLGGTKVRGTQPGGGRGVNLGLSLDEQHVIELVCIYVICSFLREEQVNR